MAVLSDSERAIAARTWVEKVFVELGVTASLDHAQIRAAVDAADDWADLNAAAYNLALPLAFRNGATIAQKTLLLTYVILRRAGIF